MTLSGTLVMTRTTWTARPPRLVPNNFSYEPTDFSYHPGNGRWYFSDDDVHKIFEVDLGPDGAYGTADDVIRAFSTTTCGAPDAEGVAVDTWNGSLLVAGGVNAQIYNIGPGANGVFDGCAPDGDDTVTSFDTASLGVASPEGIAFNALSGTVYFVGNGSSVVETTVAGSLVQVIDISSVGGQALSGVEWAPSSDNAGAESLYITDRRVDNGADPLENDGRIYEFSLPPTKPIRLYLPGVFE
jgi:hypothetical protein